MSTLRYLALGLGYIAAGLILACIIFAFALPVMVYVVWTNWKDYTL